MRKSSGYNSNVHRREDEWMADNVSGAKIIQDEPSWKDLL